MAEIGFPLFFVALIAASVFVMAQSVAANWERILAALDGRLVKRPAVERVLAVSVGKPIDLPYVARRMGRPAAETPRVAAPGRRKAA